MPTVAIPIQQLRQQMASVLQELKTGSDVLVTQRGRGAAMLVDVERYNHLIERLEYLEDSLDALEAEREGAVDLDDFLSESEIV